MFVCLFFFFRFFFFFCKIGLRAASTRKLVGSVPGRVPCAQAAAIASLTRLLSASADAGLTTDRFHAIPGCRGQSKSLRPLPRKFHMTCCQVSCMSSRRFGIAFAFPVPATAVGAVLQPPALLSQSARNKFVLPCRQRSRHGNSCTNCRWELCVAGASALYASAARLALSP